MIDTNLNETFGLDRIKKITHKTNRYTNMYIIEFENDERKLYASELHCFLSDNNKPKRICDLVSGDLIWIDLHAFSKDGSLK
jgi:hypothetical protein